MIIRPKPITCRDSESILKKCQTKKAENRWTKNVFFTTETFFGFEGDGQDFLF